MNRIAIIPARGGSKRIPGKNIKDFLGKPIIAYSIQTALASNLFDEVMVSTDDFEIAKIAEEYGAKVPFVRSKKNSDDYASTIEVIQEVLSEYDKIGVTFNYSCCIYPTAPLIDVKHIKEGFDKLIEEKLDTVFPVVPFSYPIWRALRKKHEKTVMLWPEYLASRSQDLEEVFHDAGQWYWLRNHTLSNILWTDNTDTIELAQEEVQDIDNESDWKLAEMKYSLMLNQND